MLALGGGQVLRHEDLDARSPCFDLAGVDARLADDGVHVAAIVVGCGRHQARAVEGHVALGDEAQTLVSSCALDDAALPGEFEDGTGRVPARRFLHGGAQLRVALALDPVEPRRLHPRVHQQGERAPGLDRLVLHPVADQDDLGADGVRAPQQRLHLPARHEAGFVHDPELRA